MKSFEVEGVSYRSISEFCRKRKVSYWKMVRLCRKYVRAQKDPAVAARWLLRIEQINFIREVKTIAYLRDSKMSKLRVTKSLFRQKSLKNKKLIETIY